MRSLGVASMRDKRQNEKKRVVEKRNKYNQIRYISICVNVNLFCWWCFPRVTAPWIIQRDHTKQKYAKVCFTQRQSLDPFTGDFLLV